MNQAEKNDRPIRSISEADALTMPMFTSDSAAGGDPLVSVIVRSMGRPTLSDALDSVARQTYPNIEVVVVDARGCDHGQLSGRYVSLRLRVVDDRQPLRRSRAANLGLESARGEFLIFLDDDDWFAPDHVSSLADALRDHPDRIAAYSRIVGADEGGSPIDREFGQSFDRIRLLAGNYIPVHAVLFRRHAVDQGCRMDERFDLYEDWDFWLQVAQFGDFIFVDKPTGHYRIGGAFGRGINPDGDVMVGAIGRVLEKWKNIWRHEDLLEIMARVGAHDERLMALTRDNGALAAANQGLSTENRSLAAKHADAERRCKELQRANQQVGDELRRLSGEVHSLQLAVHEYAHSTSWRVTKPLRFLGRGLQRVRQLLSALSAHQRRHPGIRGYRRLAGRLYAAWRSAGMSGMSHMCALHVAGNQTGEVGLAGRSILVIDEERAGAPIPSGWALAVHLHVFYTDLLAEICGYLGNIPFPFTLFATTDTDDKAAAIRDAFSAMIGCCDLRVSVVENRGRDIAPMITELGRTLRRYDLVLHIHTKRSPHNPDLRGWRSYLMQAVLGSRQLVAAIVDRFVGDPSLGVLYPAPYFPVQPFMRLGGNVMPMTGLLRRSGRPPSEMIQIDERHFPAGAMFWFRGKAIDSLVELDLASADFDREAGQDDGTLAHAIERMIPYFAAAEDLATDAYLPSCMHFPQLVGALPLTAEAFSRHFATGRRATIFFDHNIGGGTNTYSHELTRSIIDAGELAVRVYFQAGSATWVVQVADRDDGMIYGAADTDALFEILRSCPCNRIVVNSLIGFLDIARLIDDIVGLSKRLEAILEYKLHDYYAVCPSQHLMNIRDDYCGIPADEEACDRCFRSNPHVDVDRGRVPSVAVWRRQFARLFDAATEISMFDSSSTVILARAFELPEAKLHVRPHDNHSAMAFAPLGIPDSLHFGVLGTLTTAKGAGVVNDLAGYVEAQGLRTPITVIGRSLVQMHPSIRILGAYDVAKLREILEENRISVLFMASIVPETFGYTISEAIELGLPVVAFDIGAQGTRVGGYRNGKVVPLGSPPGVIFQALNDIWSDVRKD